MFIGFLKQAINSLQLQSQGRTSYRVNQWCKWLSPGLAVKRWLLISIGGVFLASLGLAIWVKLTPIFWILELLKGLFGFLADILPNYISGPVLLVSGVLLVLWGQSRTVGSITEVLRPIGDEEELIDVLLAHRRLYRGPKIVVLGGGTGLSTLLRGLKTYSANITAIVTVADDGGSSGRLR